MKKKLSNIIIIVLFISMITIPQTVAFLINDEKTISEEENRKLSEKPKFSLSTIAEYPNQFDAYYNDHLPFRTFLRETWTNFNYNAIRTVDNSIVIGKDDWFFYRGENSIEDAQGVDTFTDETKEEIIETVQKNKEKLEKHKIDFYLMIIPNKENLYKECLPKTINIINDTSKTEKLIDEIKEKTDVKIVYPKEELMKAKEKYQLFMKHDTHWNEIGACVGTIALQKAIDPKFEYDINSLEVREEGEEFLEDLAKFAGIKDQVSEPRFIPSNFYPEVELPDEEKMEYTTNAEIDKTVLFIGDSFSGAIKRTLPKLYKKVYYMQRESPVKEETIEKIKPDIVVYEVVERYSSELKKEI